MSTPEKASYKIRDWIDINKIDYAFLSLNSNAIHSLEQNLDKIDWCCLSRNPNAINLLEQNLDKVDWSRLSSNPNAIYILKENTNRIDWREFSKNPAIFEIDYQALEDSNPPKEDIMSRCLHPDHLV